MLGLVGACAATDQPVEAAFETIRPGFDVAAEEAAWAAEDPTGLRNTFDADDLYPDVRRALTALRRLNLRLIVAGNQPREGAGALRAMDLPVDDPQLCPSWFTKPALGSSPPSDLARFPARNIAYVGDHRQRRPAGRRRRNAPLFIRRGPWGHLHALRPEAKRATIIDSLDELPAAIRGT